MAAKPFYCRITLPPTTQWLNISLFGQKAGYLDKRLIFWPLTLALQPLTGEKNLGQDFLVKLS